MATEKPALTPERLAALGRYVEKAESVRGCVDVVVPSGELRALLDAYAERGVREPASQAAEMAACGVDHGPNNKGPGEQGRRRCVVCDVEVGSRVEHCGQPTAESITCVVCGEPFWSDDYPCQAELHRRLAATGVAPPQAAAGGDREDK